MKLSGKMKPLLTLTLILTAVGMLVPGYEGEGGGGAEGCYTGCHGDAQSGGGYVYLSGVMPFGKLPFYWPGARGADSGRWHFGVPCRAFVVDAYPDEWYGVLLLPVLVIDIICAAIMAWVLLLFPWPKRRAR